MNIKKKSVRTLGLFRESTDLASFSLSLYPLHNALSFLLFHHYNAQNFTTFIVGLIVAFTRGWDLTLVGLSIIPLLAVVGYFMGVATTKVVAKANEVRTSHMKGRGVCTPLYHFFLLFNALFRPFRILNCLPLSPFSFIPPQAYTSANSCAQEALVNIRTVAALQLEETCDNKYRGRLHLPFKAGVFQSWAQGVTLGTFDLVIYCAFSAILYYGAVRVSNGKLTGGKVISVLFCVIVGGERQNKDLERTLSTCMKT
jgi:ATP-binding cassette, subfamily B (MDR/TAP), member 1